MTNNIENISEIIGDENSVQVQLLTPGQLLFKERVARNLSIDYVAQQTLLSKQVIIDIENDVTSNIYEKVALVYVKGYLKAYAKLFEISEEQIFQALDNFKRKGEQQTEVTISDFVREEFKNQRRKNVRTINHFSRRTVGIVVIAIVIAICTFLISMTYNRTIPNVKNVDNIQIIEKPIEQSETSNLLNDPVDAGDLLNQ